MAAYSHLFSAGNAAGAGTHPAYTVPSGMVVVIREASCLLYSTPSNISFFVAGVGTIIQLKDLGAAQTWNHVAGRWVINAGMAIQLTLTGGGGEWWLSGYLLSAA